MNPSIYPLVAGLLLAFPATAADQTPIAEVYGEAVYARDVAPSAEPRKLTKAQLDNPIDGTRDRRVVLGSWPRE